MDSQEEPLAQANTAAAHDAWFRAKVKESLADPRPAISHEKVESHFADRRAPQGVMALFRCRQSALLAWIKVD